MMKKYISMLMTMLMTISMIIPVFANEVNDDIVILHTNDTHCGIEDGIGFAGVAAYKKEMEQIYGTNVTLVDAGDVVQGGPIGKLTTGSALIQLMNEVGYDIFVPGNHEFDYEIPRFFELMNQLHSKIIACNFMDLTTNESVFDAYTIVDYNGIKVGYVGIITPETFTKATPAYFQDENGNFLYSFCEDVTGTVLYNSVQTAVDAAIADGAQYIVAIGHLGIEEVSEPWRSTDVIANTTGIDVMIDGHSHSYLEGEIIANKNGESVLLNQAGEKFDAIGKIVIDPTTDTISAELVTDFEGKDGTVQTAVDAVNAEFATLLNQVVAATAVPLVTSDPTTGELLIRSQETNLGDLCADAYRTILGADVAILNGGGIRASIDVGEITNEDIINVQPFGNNGTSVRVKGQALLDALELGAKNAPGQSGGFLQVSGMTYAVDLTVPSSVETDDQGGFIGVNGEYRVKNVMIGDEPLDLNKDYVVAAYDYLLLSAGDGMTMFAGAEIVKDRVIVDNEILINYITNNLGGIVGEAYANPYGSGRITISDVPIEGSTTASGLYTVVRGDSLWKIAQTQLGNGNRFLEIYAANQDIMDSANVIYVGQVLKIPA